MYTMFTYDDPRYNYLKVRLPKNPKLIAACGSDISISSFPSHRIYPDSAIYNCKAKGNHAAAYVEAKFIWQDSTWLLKSMDISPL
jgi:hypothetical protein